MGSNLKLLNSLEKLPQIWYISCIFISFTFISSEGMQALFEGSYAQSLRPLRALEEVKTYIKEFSTQFGKEEEICQHYCRFLIYMLQETLKPNLKEIA